MAAFRSEVIVTHEFRWPPKRLNAANFDRFFFLSFARAFALLLHQFLESHYVNHHALFASNELCQIEGEAVRVVKPKSHVARNLVCCDISAFLTAPSFNGSNSSLQILVWHVPSSRSITA